MRPADPKRWLGAARRPRALAAAVFALALLAPCAAAEDFSLFPASVPASHFFEPPDAAAPPRFRISDLVRWWPWGKSKPDAPEGFRIGVDIEPPVIASESFPPLPPLPPRTVPPLWTNPTKLTTGIVLTGAGIYGLTAGWAHGFNAFHFGDEGWFSPNSYGGGSDKVSHFIVSASLGRELALVYDLQGHTVAQSIALSFGITAFSGFIVEAVDGFTPYGFSWEDLTADVLGTATGLFLTRQGLNDLIGLRLGKVAGNVPVPEGTEPALGTVYSGEIYSGDFKIAGLARRMQFNAGPARFLMTSVTYSTKGYGYDPTIPSRQRLIGVELGLNLPEILSAVGVPDNTWWGTFLYKFLNFFRIPFTSFGFRYNLNDGTWHGPDTGNVYY
jgi:uncharacterized protein YfiM (DUF2279 family)